MLELKKIFTKHLLVITIIFPLIIILLYGFSISLALKYKHNLYVGKELKRYEKELKSKHKKFLIEKAKYIESFMNYIYTKTSNNPSVSTEGILDFIDSIKKYDSGFIFIFDKNGNVIKHPCTETLVNLVHSNQEKTLVSRLITAANEHKFVYYEGTNCIDNKGIRKIAFVHHIKTTDLYIVISKNEKDILYSIAEKKKIWEAKLDDETEENIRLLILLSFISIIFSIIFSKIINRLIKDYEKEIKESNEAMFSQSRLAQAGELISMISHQWRQPISKIASISSNLRFKIMMDKELDSAYLDKKIEEIEEYTEFLSETIDDFREFYKPKKDKQKMNVLPLIDKSLQFLENSLMKKNINLIKEYDKDSKVLLYHNEFMQVVINIVQNAIEFSRKGAFIKVKTKLKPKEYVIEISDEAGGIKDENIEKIFDAHFSTKLNTNSTNLGLGLYVSKVIIETHFNGKLEVESNNKNTTFTIRLIR
ncbi:MAG: Histidine kinase [uncultured Sulfurovum sp.]|uniref:histidine kinase n=1 Tax=uncultured Sulfurovum sp. TaxID=269237 RepID=A0A6S6RY94_9BACT|nr:MAG: Histidine kinase [uncultured Sulfurovum sp.]